MYEPLVVADDSYNSDKYVVTPEPTMQRTTKLSQGYEELREDLLEEVNMVDTRIIKPATEAKEWIQPLKKVIKKREDRKVCLQDLPTETWRLRFAAGFREIPNPGR